jgi:long-chain fatty acid transport protein
VKKSYNPGKSLVCVAVLSALASLNAQAGGFSLYTEGSASAVSNYAAGIAAEGADASIGWYNPAGLVLIKNEQAVAGGVGVFPNASITGTSSFVTPGLPAYNQSFTDLDGGRNGFVPSLHYAKPLGERAVFGISTIAPFGLATNWEQNSPVRYSATHTKLLTFNVAPEMGVKVADNFAFGAGLDFQYAKVTFNRMIGTPTLLQVLPAVLGGTPYTMDSISDNRADSFGIGFHAGVMGMFNDNHTRVGINYQSRMNHRFDGQSKLTGRMADPTAVIGTGAFGNINSVYRYNHLQSNSVSLPDIATLSIYHDVNDTFAVLGSVVYTNWNTFKEVQLNGVAAAGVGPAPFRVVQTVVNSTAAENYQGAWRGALGVNYKANEKLLVKVGGGYDQTPTNNVDRDIRLPDADRWALSAGAHYQMRPDIGIDFGYTHLFGAEDSTINKVEAVGTSTYTIRGTASASADLVALGLVWNMDQAPEKAVYK